MLKQFYVTALEDQWAVIDRSDPLRTTSGVFDAVVSEHATRREARNEAARRNAEVQQEALNHRDPARDADGEPGNVSE